MTRPRVTAQHSFEPIDHKVALELLDAAVREVRAQIEETVQADPSRQGDA